MRNPSNGTVGLALGLGLGLAALACDGGSGDDGRPSVPVAPSEEPGSTPSGDPCASGSPPVNCPSHDPVEPAPRGPNEVDEDVPVDRIAATDLARARVQSILESNCGACHGHLLTSEDASGGINYVDDIDALVEHGQIVPLSSADSRIVQVMRSGEMPPPGSGSSRVSDAEIDIIVELIDNPLYWAPIGRPEQPCPEQRLGFDAVYAAVAADLAQLEPIAALSARYISLANRVNAAVCVTGDGLALERQALFKLLNMVSTAPEVRAPVPIDESETLYRIDLADYGWDRDVTVVDSGGNAVPFRDKWEAIVAHDPYAIPFVGDDAAAAASLSGTSVPMLLARPMLHAAVSGNLYYALIGVDVQVPLDTFVQDELGIDIPLNLQEREQVRAVTSRSRIRPQGLVIQRDELGSRPGVLWQQFDFVNDDLASAVDDAFQIFTGRSEAIFTLPNGSFAFLQTNEGGTIVTSQNVSIGDDPNASTLTAVSCSYCHAGGIIPVADELRENVLRNAPLLALDDADVSRFDAVFPSAVELARLVETDNATFVDAMTAARLPSTSIDPVGRVYFAFERELTLPDAAGDLGLTASELDALLPELPPALQALATGTLGRSAFTQLYRATVCELPRAGNNRPAPSVCSPAAP